MTAPSNSGVPRISGVSFLHRERRGYKLRGTYVHVWFSDSNRDQ